MTKFSGALSYTIKKVWHGLAILLVTAAVLLSLFRYALPHVDEHKDFVQDYVQNKFGIDLKIGRISATWRGYGPSLVLSDVTLSQTDASPVHFNVDKVWVDINFWQSMGQRLLISERFDIQGARLEILPENFKSKDKAEYPLVKALKNLFLIQLQRFNITDGQVIVTTHSQQETYEIDTVAWINEGEHHQGSGNIRVSELSNNAASFVVDLTGDVDTLSGNFFAKADDLDVSPWLNEWLTTQYPLQASRANISAWLSVKDNTFDQMHIELGGSSLSWDAQKDTELLTEFNSGTIQARPNESGWAFRVDQLVISQAGETFVTDLVGRSDQQGNVLINTVKPINLAPVSSVLALFTGDEFTNKLKKLDVAGELATLQIQWLSQQPSIRAKLLDVSWQNFDNVPGLNAIDLELVWHQSKGHINASASNAVIDMNSINGQVLGAVNIDSDIYLYESQDHLTPGWMVSIPSLSVASDTLRFSAQIEHQLATNFAQVIFNLERFDLNKVPLLLPNTLIKERTIAFLNRALSGKGTVEAAHVIWSGNPTHFPFKDNKGIFQANIEVDNADFAFSPAWPALTHMDMSMLIENNSLTVQSPGGYLDAVELSYINASIPELKASSAAVISVKGTGTGKSVSEMLERSTLTKLSSLLNERLIVDGELDADLTLTAPLTKKRKPHAKGAITFNSANVFVSSLKLDFAKARGALSFNDGRISAEQLKGELYGQPVSVSLNGKQQEEDYKLDVGVSGQWNASKAFENLSLPLKESVSGQFNWNADISALLSPEDTYYELELKSDLLGMEATLPLPLYKESDMRAPLVIKSTGGKKQSEVSLYLDGNVSFTGILQHDPLTFSQSLLRVGKQGGIVPIEDHALIANLPEVTLSQWTTVKRNIDSHYDSRAPRDVRLLPTPQRVYIESDEVKVGSQTFNNVRLNATQENLLWRAELSSKQALATAVIPANWQEDGINLLAEKLHLTKASSNESTDVKTPKPLNLSFPLRFRCEDCRLDDILIGKVDAEFNPEPQGVFIDRLNINHPDASLIASGRWQYDSNTFTQLNGQLKSGDFGRWLDSLGLSSGIKDSEADFQFNLNWQGSPADFSLAGLNGEMQWELSDGYLTQVSDKGSRLFTLFSFDSLLRKLSLDFRDVFAQGFFYDDIKGTFVMENGKASTDNTLVDGGAGEIEITGFTQLDAKELNYNISFTPNITGNLPFLVYFLANPPTALAALALDQMLTSAKVISNINYKVTGSFSDPVFTEIKRDSKDIPLPAQQPNSESQQTTPLIEEDLKRVKVDVIDS